MNTTLSWEDARIFLCVAQSGSFSSAAKLLKIGQPTVSRRIQALEDKFQLQLFSRGKYGAIPTKDAITLLQSAEQMAQWANEFNRALKGVEHSLSGKVSIAAPPAIAVEQLVPFAAQLRKREPLIRLEVLSSIDVVDLSRGEADLAIRTKRSQQPELVVLFEGTVQEMVVASKQYAREIQEPISIDKLDWITWGGKYCDLHPRPLLEELIPNFTPKFSSDDYLALQAAVECGLGVSVVNIGNSTDLIEAKLVKVDVDIPLKESKFYVVCAKSMQHVPRVAIVAQLLGEAMSKKLK